jgi:hypothetical protein
MSLRYAGRATGRVVRLRRVLFVVWLLRLAARIVERLPLAAHERKVALDGLCYAASTLDDVSERGVTGRERPYQFWRRAQHIPVVRQARWALEHQARGRKLLGVDPETRAAVARDDEWDP